LDQIKAYCRVLAREFHPRKIILIGSYAYGRPTKHSDVDLVVLLSSRKNGARSAERIRSRVEAPFPLDLLVWTPQHVAKRLAKDCGFTQEVLSRGKTIYEAGNR
jgi:predicted nucleotidyltransferase